jgi:hypothetical protein
MLPVNDGWHLAGLLARTLSAARSNDCAVDKISLEDRLANVRLRDCEIGSRCRQVRLSPVAHKNAALSAIIWARLAEVRFL